MINYFRHIRQSLLSESKMGKYLKYAIGEIVLVVIGILIALSINNWNETRKDRILQKTYIKRLITDLHQDTLNVNRIHLRITKAQDIISEFMQTLQSESTNTNDFPIFEKYFTEGWVLLDFNTQNTTYTDLSQTGNINIFENTLITEKIVSYYSLVEKLSLGHAINKEWVLPLDASVTEKTPALEFSAQTKVLFKKGHTPEFLEIIQKHKTLFERNAAVHFLINKSFLNRLALIKNEAKELLEDLNK